MSTIYEQKRSLMLKIERDFMMYLIFKDVYNAIPIEVRKEKERQEADKLRGFDRKGWKKYRRRVWKITEGQPIQELPGYMFRGYDNFHLDHIISIWHGFKNGIPAEHIGHISNLRFIPKASLLSCEIF